MIVEPDDHIRKLQGIILQKHASADVIVEKRSLAEALPIFAAEKFDFVMLDVSRPTDDLREFFIYPGRSSSRQ